MTHYKLSNQTLNIGSGSGGDQWFHAWDAGFNLSWELDLWGRFRRSIESKGSPIRV